MKELTLVIFKPDVFEQSGIKNKIKDKFFTALKENGLEVIITGKKFRFTKEIAEAHYGHVKKYNNGAEIYRDTQEFMLSGDSQPMIVWGEDAITKVRGIIGPTRDATTGLRATSESAIKDSPKNWVHASGLAKGADPYAEVKEELLRFFPDEYWQLVTDPKYSGFLKSPSFMAEWV